MIDEPQPKTARRWPQIVAAALLLVGVLIGAAILWQNSVLHDANEMLASVSYGTLQATDSAGLAVQMEISRAITATLIVQIIGTVAGTVGLWFVYRTLRATEAAVREARLTREADQQLRRGWLDVTIEAVPRRRFFKNRPLAHATVRLEVKGQDAARDVRFAARIFAVADAFEDEEETREMLIEDLRDHLEEPGSTIPPGSSIARQIWIASSLRQDDLQDGIFVLKVAVQYRGTTTGPLEVVVLTAEVMERQPDDSDHNQSMQVKLTAANHYPLHAADAPLSSSPSLTPATPASAPP